MRLLLLDAVVAFLQITQLAKISSCFWPHCYKAQGVYSCRQLPVATLALDLHANTGVHSAPAVAKNEPLNSRRQLQSAWQLWQMPSRALSYQLQSSSNIQSTWACCSGASVALAFGFQFTIELATPLGVAAATAPHDARHSPLAGICAPTFGEIIIAASSQRVVQMQLLKGMGMPLPAYPQYFIHIKA